jgi:flagellar hook-associated protein FlgK
LQDPDEIDYLRGDVMDIGSVVNQGLLGIQNSQASIQQSAQKIASAATKPAEPVDLVEPLINIKAQTQVFDSSAKVVKAADEAIGTLLDIKA